jgi:site-specific recombinase XerD
MTTDQLFSPRPLRVAFQSGLPPSASPYRLLDEQGRSLVWANDFLDAKCLQQRSLRSLRAYAYDLLHFARWWQIPQPRPKLSEITEALLLDYVRYQLDQLPQPTPQTVNHRLFVVRALSRFHGNCLLVSGAPAARPACASSSGLAYRRRPAAAERLRLSQPRRVILPLTADQVNRFWNSFQCFRDLALVGLMLWDGLRSCEVLALQLADLQLAEGQIRVQGKGNKQRVLPLPKDLIQVLQTYLLLERPQTNSPALFVSLKGRARGLPLSAAGLRSLFRYHRATQAIPQANPHRFRHTFATDMVRDGISLPSLQHLMGHAHIRTTMIYVQLAPQDVWQQYHHAIAKRTALASPLS